MNKKQRTMKTLNEFLQKHDIKVPTDWYYASLTVEIIKKFVNYGAAYTFLPEYLANSDFASAKSTQSTFNCCKRIAKDFNLNAEKLINATFKKVFALIDANLTII